jgi:acetylornithine deacetylase
MTDQNLYQLQEDAVSLLKQLISIPSFSREEQGTAAAIETFLAGRGVATQRHLNNIWAVNKHFDPAKPSILLNSHHDTVKPNKGYTLDPFSPLIRDGKLYGLGSNDAGGCLVSLIATFLHFYEKTGLRYNLVLAATAEEEISGTNGVEALLPLLPDIDSAIVGEPTKMEMAVAERGLMVLDCIATGQAGHAARKEGESALYKAMDDIQLLRQMKFARVSELLGEVKVSVTVIETANKAHNVVPAECSFVADVRVNELYTLEEVAMIIRGAVGSKIKPRSLRMRSTAIPTDHPLVQAGLKLGKGYYGSPTTSDKALMPFPALKMGPGDSARSHTADEFILLDEIDNGIADYVKLLNQLL